MIRLRYHRTLAIAASGCVLASTFVGCGADDEPAPPVSTSQPTAEPQPEPSATTTEPVAEESEIDPLDETFRRLYDKVDFQGLEALPENQQVVYLVLRVRYEVLQGGLEYYFFNPAAEHARESVVALEKIGMPDASADLAAACDLFPDETPADDVFARQNQLDTFTAEDRIKLEELNTSLSKSLETAGEKVEYYLETYNVEPEEVTTEETPDTVPDVAIE